MQQYQPSSRANENLYLLSILDVNGLEEYSPLRAMVYPEIDIFLLCFGVMRTPGLEHIRDVWLPEIRGPCPKAQFLLIGLQADQRDKATAIWGPSVTKEEAVSTAAELGAIKYIECSALLNQGLQDVFAEALLAGIEVVATRKEDTSPPLRPAPRNRTLSNSILGLPRKIFDFRGRMQGRREPEMLQSVPEEFVVADVQEDIGLDAEPRQMMSIQGKGENEESIHSQQVTNTQETQTRASMNFEEALSRTWVYTHLGRRALLQSSSIQDNATSTSKIRSSQATVTASSRSILSIPMTWAPSDRRSIISWGSAEHNATANLEIIEQYAANLESLQTELVDAALPPQTTQTWNDVSIGDNARALLGNSYHHVTNNYVINYSRFRDRYSIGVSYHC